MCLQKYLYKGKIRMKIEDFLLKIGFNWLCKGSKIVGSLLKIYDNSTYLKRFLIH